MPFPPYVRKPLAFATAALGVLFAQGAAAIEPTANVIEYYNAPLNHFFITAYQDEAAMLDQGLAIRGGPGKGPNSHFYTADANECAVVKQNPGWTFEAIAFYIEVAQAGACKAGTTPVYRSFYPGAGVSQSNHRFLPDLTMSEHM